MHFEIKNKMEIIFEKEYLKELYYNGITRDKQHLYQPHIVKSL